MILHTDQTGLCSYVECAHAARRVIPHVISDFQREPGFKTARLNFPKVVYLIPVHDWPMMSLCRLLP